MAEALAKDIQSEAQSALSSSPIFDLREIHVEATESGLLLQGRVATFYHKQLAQEAIRAIANGMHVQNDIDVE
jgi:osmotically-inducible protein OsmY